jgi:sulfur carrier protein ThiS
MTVKLILRDREYEVKPGMTLLDSLKKINVLPESVIATRKGEMILEDEILKDGEVVKLIAVISGGSCHFEEPTTVRDEAISSHNRRLPGRFWKTRNHRKSYEM